MRALDSTDRVNIVSEWANETSIGDIGPYMQTLVAAKIWRHWVGWVLVVWSIVGLKVVLDAYI